MERVPNMLSPSIEEETLIKLRELVEGTPDVFFVLTGAMKYNQANDSYASGSFVDADENSVRSTGTPLATGGRDRVLATAAMHFAYPEAVIVAMSRTRDETKPTYASVIKEELIRKAVAEDQILLEERSVDTITEFKEAAKMWSQFHWKNMVFILADFHIPRAQALFNHIKNFATDDDEANILSDFIDAIKNDSLRIQFVSSTDVLITKSEKYRGVFEKLKELPSMQARIAVEEKAVEQIKNGTYGLKADGTPRQIPEKIYEDKP